MSGDVLNILTIILIVGACIGLAFIPAKIASKKGYSYSLFYIFGLFGVIPALITALLFKDTSSAPIGTKGTSTLVIILAIVVLSIIAIGITTPKAPAVTVDYGPILEDKVTLENYNRINSGMSYSQVVDILGPGEQLQKNKYYEYYHWRSENGGSLTIIFTDGVVLSISQSGLR